MTTAGLVPATRNATVLSAAVTWNYTTYLNIAAIALTLALVWRFLRTDGRTMLKMIGRSSGTARRRHIGG